MDVQKGHRKTHESQRMNQYLTGSFIFVTAACCFKPEVAATLVGLYTAYVGALAWKTTSFNKANVEEHKVDKGVMQ